MSRWAVICVTLEPEKVEITVPCDEFNANDDGSVHILYNGELWAFFAGPEYVHIIDDALFDYTSSPDSEIPSEKSDEEDDDEEDEEGDDDENVDEVVDSVVVPDDLAELASLPPAKDDPESL